MARAIPSGVDGHRHRLSPKAPLTDDANIKSYISTCQQPRWATHSTRLPNGIITAAMVNQAWRPTDANNYRRHCTLQRRANDPNGDQLRVYNGLYLNGVELGERENAVNAFGDLVDYGLRNNRWR